MKSGRGDDKSDKYDPVALRTTAPQPAVEDYGTFAPTYLGLSRPRTQIPLDSVFIIN